jgi:hypothetical protein
MLDSLICNGSALHRILWAVECLYLLLALAAVIVMLNRRTRAEIVAQNRAELHALVALGAVSSTIALGSMALRRGGIDGTGVAVIAAELFAAAAYYFCVRLTVAVQAGQPARAVATGGTPSALDRWSAHSRVFCRSVDTTRLGLVIRRVLGVVAVGWFAVVVRHAFCDSDPQGCLLTGEPFGAIVDALRHVASGF